MLCGKLLKRVYVYELVRAKESIFSTFGISPTSTFSRPPSPTYQTSPRRAPPHRRLSASNRSRIMTSLASAPAVAFLAACLSGGSNFPASCPSRSSRCSDPENPGATGSATCRCWLNVSVERGGPTRARGLRIRVTPPTGPSSKGCGSLALSVLEDAAGRDPGKLGSVRPACSGAFPAQPSSNVRYGFANERGCEFRAEHARGGFE